MIRDVADAWSHIVSADTPVNAIGRAIGGVASIVDKFAFFHT
jgi:hypothetical protein